MRRQFDSNKERSRPTYPAVMLGSGFSGDFRLGQIFKLVSEKERKKEKKYTRNFVTTYKMLLIKNDNRSMLNNRSTAQVVPSWDTCIEALFDAHLPIKFAFTGRLSLHDVTRDGFYVLRRNICRYFLYLVSHSLASLLYTFIYCN